MGVTRIGVAGWDYRDWNGVVYPNRPARGFDRLAHVARYVDTIEVNSTFYRPVAPRIAESWVRRTADRSAFRFTAKSHRSWTHETDADLERTVATTLEGLGPLRDADKLGAVLVQFPQSFHFAPTATDRIERLIRLAESWPLVVELRHTSWESEPARDWFDTCGAGWCAVDQPQVGRSTLGLVNLVCGSVGYLRLHGRNRANWFKPDAGRDARYDYLYGAEEIASLAGTVGAMAESAESLFVIQNNHFRGQALVNALQMRHLVDGTRPAAPEDLVATYPELSGQVTVERTRLF